MKYVRSNSPSVITSHVPGLAGAGLGRDGPVSHPGRRAFSASFPFGGAVTKDSYLV